jgi:hypothetical protein
MGTQSFRGDIENIEDIDRYVLCRGAKGWSERLKGYRGDVKGAQKP